VKATQTIPTEIAPRVWRWTARHPEWHGQHPWTHEVAGFALESDDALVLVDPLLPAGTDAAAATLDRLDELAHAARAVAIFVTIPYHVRSSEELRERFDATLHGHPACARRLRRPDVLADVTGGSLPAGADAIRIGSPLRQETPLFFPEHRALAFGDAVVGVDGEARVWETVGKPSRARWYRDRFVPSLRPLLEVDAELLLFTHGPPVLRGGREALERGLAAPPWHYR